MKITAHEAQWLIATLIGVGLTTSPANAWQAKRAVRVEGGHLEVIDGAIAGGEEQPGPPAAKPGEAKPGEPNKTADPNKPKEGEEKAKDGEKKKEKDGPAPVTTRPPKPRTPPNPDELKNLKPDENGRIKFNLKGQPWPDVLDWLAETSQKSLDWQELPNDYLNLVTQQSYSIEEARDLLNRHLLARGFTMLTHGETISVVNIAKINPGMVPRVEPSDLDDLPDHDFVKTSFPLAWLLSDQAENELKPMLSPNGKLTHLTNTNRLEAMDSVRNLREIWRVIREEQSSDKQEQLVREFKLKHTKAPEVLDQLHTLLGINKPNPRTKRNGSSGGGGGMNPDMMMQFQQQMQQMMQQMQQGMQQAQGGGGRAKPTPADVRLLANERENSILANAPPDKMAIIAQAVKTLDVPPSLGEHLLQNVQRMQVYRLSGVEPQALIDLLDEVGSLEPTTKLQVDSKNKSIVAYASLADHMTIKLLVDKLDGTSRKFQVIPLRKLEADYVAGTIEFMMGGAEKDRNQNRRPYYFDFYDPFMFGGGAPRLQTESSDKFRVDADVENNRLLLWANEIELREIENLLIKLGELPPPGGNRSTRRYLEQLDPDEAEQLLERIRRLWPGISSNELIIEDAAPRRPARPEPAESPETQVPDDAPAPRGKRSKFKSSKPVVPATTAPTARATRNPAAHEIAMALAEVQVDTKSDQAAPTNTDESHNDSDANEELPAARQRTRPRSNGLGEPRAPQTPPPIYIRRGPDGRLILESQDTAALDQLEELLHETAPPKRDYKVFYLKYPTTWAYSVEMNLKDFFEVDKKKSGSSFNPFFGYRPGDSSQDSSRRLSKRKPLKFISDSDSGTIIVQGATSEQLKIIEALINIYDQPPETDGKQIRQTKVFTLKYSKATVIAEAIKDVYRDLLSSNDKAYQNNPQSKDGQKPPQRNYTFIYGNSGEDNQDKKQETPVKFKGLISLGVDDVSNTIIVSAPETLLENVSELIDQLDRAARPSNSVHVVRLDGKVNSTELQKRLSKILTKPQQRPQQQKPSPQPPQQPPQPETPPEEPIFLP